MARRIARGYARRVPVAVEELEQAAREGLWDGLRRTAHGERNELYLRRRIRGAIQDYLRSIDRLPRRMRQRLEELDQEPPRFKSIDDPLEPIHLVDTGPPVDELVLDRCEEHARWRMIGEALPLLLDRDAEVIRLRAQGVQMDRIAQRLQLSPPRIAQLYSRAMAAVCAVLDYGNDPGPVPGLKERARVPSARIAAALTRCDGDRTAAAAQLGMRRDSLSRVIRERKITVAPPEPPPPPVAPPGPPPRTLEDIRREAADRPELLEEPAPLALPPPRTLEEIRREARKLEEEELEEAEECEAEELEDVAEEVAEDVADEELEEPAELDDEPEPPALRPLRLPELQLRIERTLLARALRQTHGNKSAAARLLGLRRTTLHEALRRHGMFPPPEAAH